MISRTAENCFWLTRNLERVEMLNNAIEVTHDIALETDADVYDTWFPLVIVLGGQESFLEDQKVTASHDENKILEFLVWDKDNQSSIYTSFSNARENARIVRDLMSYEMWEVMNRAWLWLNKPATKKLFKSDLNAFCLELSETCSTWKGMFHDLILRDDPYYFMKLGMTLERANLTARLMDVHYHRHIDLTSSQETMYESLYWQEMLQYCMSYDAFVRRPYFDVGREQVAEFLLQEPDFPRTIAYCLKDSINSLGEVRQQSKYKIGNDCFEKLFKTYNILVDSEIIDILDSSHEFLTALINDLAELCSQIQKDFFDVDVETFSKMLSSAK